MNDTWRDDTWQVFDDFNQLSADNSSVAPQHAQFETLVGACAVVDARNIGAVVHKRRRRDLNFSTAAPMARRRAGEREPTTCATRPHFVGVPPTHARMLGLGEDRMGWRAGEWGEMDKEPKVDFRQFTNTQPGGNGDGNNLNGDSKLAPLPEVEGDAAARKVRDASYSSL